MAPAHLHRSLTFLQWPRATILCMSLEARVSIRQHLWSHPICSILGCNSTPLCLFSPRHDSLCNPFPTWNASSLFSLVYYVMTPICIRFVAHGSCMISKALVYAVGASVTRHLHAYDIVSGTWMDLSEPSGDTLPLARSRHSIAILQGVLYAFGGLDSGTPRPIVVRMVYTSAPVFSWILQVCDDHPSKPLCDNFHCSRSENH